MKNLFLYNITALLYCLYDLHCPITPFKISKVPLYPEKLDTMEYMHAFLIMKCHQLWWNCCLKRNTIP